MAEQVNGSMIGSVDMSGQLSGSPAVSNYEKLGKKPQINGVELIGNKSFEELGLLEIIVSKENLENLQKEVEQDMSNLQQSVEKDMTELQQSFEKEIENLQKAFENLVDGNEVAY